MQELSSYLYEQIYENPFFDVDAASETDKPEPRTPTVQERRTEGADGHDLDTPEAELKIEYNEIWSAPRAGGGEYASQAYDSEPNFADMLCEQAGALKLEPDFYRLCIFLIHSLDRRGYFRDSPEEVAELLGLSEFEVMQALYLVQSLQPTGVGARILEECLLLQLVESRHFSQDTIRLIKNGLPLIQKGDLDAIVSLLETNREGAAAAIQIIKNLNPIPSQGYDTGEGRQVIVPDARVEKGPDGFLVVYNQRALPAMRLNEEYVRMLGNAGNKETGGYLRERLGDAKALLRALEERKASIERIIQTIVGLQPAYFEDGVSIQPMTMSQIADILELNVSTVSRAVQGKYVNCAAGTVELRRLFTSAVSSQSGEAVSSEQVKRKLKEYIGAEDRAKPLSDENLRQALALVNIHISRRTVAKYREAMDIPGSSMRKGL